MCIQKKKIIKLLMGVALVGLTLAVLCSSIFGVDVTIPDSAIKYITLSNSRRYIDVNNYGYTELQGVFIDGVQSSDYVKCYNVMRNAEDGTMTAPLFKPNYTYYLKTYINGGNNEGLFDLIGLYNQNGANTTPNNKIDLRNMPDYYLSMVVSHPMEFTFTFRATDEYDYYPFFAIVMGMTGNTSYTFSVYEMTEYYDINGTIYNQLIMEDLDNISNQIDSVNSNLVSIDSSIDDMNTNVGNKLQQVQNKIDAAADQAHQDAQDQKQAIEDLPQQQYDYEHQQDQNAADEYIEEFSGGGGTWDQDIDSYIDIEGLQESIGNLYGAFINNQKTYTIIFPGSGTVPILNKTLWTQQTINLQPFATSTPGRIMIIACNGVFSLVGIIGLVVFIRRVLQDILHH